MPSLTAYQQQFRRRLKRAIRLRASADRKARTYADKLTSALEAGANAAAVLNELNRIYNVDLSTQTLLTHSLTVNPGPELLRDTLGESTPGEETLLLVTIPDANGGEALPADGLLD